MPLVAGGFFDERSHGGGGKLRAGKLIPSYYHDGNHEDYCWNLLTFTKKAPQLTMRSKEMLANLGATITAIDDQADIKGDYTEWFSQHGDSSYALVRPDAFVYGFAKDGQALEEMLVELMNALGIRVMTKCQ